MFSIELEQIIQREVDIESPSDNHDYIEDIGSYFLTTASNSNEWCSYICTLSRTEIK